MKNSNFEISQTIDVSPDEAWNVIGAVSGVDEWLAPITSCTVEGNKRTCGTAEGSFEEEILNVDHETKTLTYRIPSQHMIPVENIAGRMIVTSAEGGKATITWAWEFDVVDEKSEEAQGAFQMIGSMGISGIESLINKQEA